MQSKAPLVAATVTRVLHAPLSMSAALMNSIVIHAPAFVDENASSWTSPT
ncbi:hypothetical protein GS539_10855 [Rhodococcus hoagii]|nr:hypothetical protein [Prescottella equi]